MLLSVTPAESSPWRSSLQLIDAHISQSRTTTARPAELRNETEKTEDFVIGPTATKHLPTHPTGQLTTPPDNSIVSPDTYQLPNFDSACPTADGEFATIRHQPWDFATRRGTLQHWSCSFSNLLSVRDALNCTETGRLTGCPARVVSPSCPIFPPPHLTVVGSCAVLDRTRWHGSQFRHGDDQIPSGGSFRAVPQQHSIFDLRVARGVRYRKGPVRWVPRHADAT